MTRLLRAAAVLLVAATSVLFWVTRADAAPQGLCSPAEWQQPGMFVECGNRLREAIGDRAGCVHAPTPSSPTSGLAGWFTTEPDADSRAGVVGLYTVYGVAGYRLDTYDTGCASEITHPQATAQTAVASMMFTAAAGVIGNANGLRTDAYNPTVMWGWADALLVGATDAVYRHIFMTVGGVMLAVAGLWLLSRARAGNLSEAVRVTGWALFALFLATAVVRWPVAAAHGADTVAGTGLRLVHQVLGPAPQNVPDEKCVFDNRAACTDSRTVSERASDTVTEMVLYRNWLRAMLGSADSPTAQTYGPALFDATALSWAEADDIAQHPELRQQILDEKAHRFAAIAEQIKTEDPEAYANLQGLRGEDRIGSALVALLSAVIYAAFDMAASLVILLGFAVFRLAVIAIPLLAAVGVMLPASAGLRRVIHATVAAVVNIVTFGAFGGLYLSFTGLIFRSDLPGPAQVVFVALAGAGCWLLLHPVRRMVHITTGVSKPGGGLLWKASAAVFDASQPAVGVIRRTAGDVWRQATTNQPPTESAPDGSPTATTDVVPVRPRPETTAGRSVQ
jgi:hypothetical protein